MPVAKLSREFYAKFGDKLTDELVNCLNTIEGSYRAEIRDLFAAQFGRFEETFERRLAHTTADVGGRIEQVQAEVERLRSGVDLKIEQLRVELHATKTDMLKWTIGLWLPVGLAVIGLYFKH